MKDVSIRNCLPDDLPELFDLWRRTGLTLGTSDSIQELERFLDCNPDTCLVAFKDGIILGGVFGGFDGRRGIAHHLAVDPSCRGLGIGRRLMQELERRYRDMSVVKVSLWIESRNEKAVEFYRRIGYELRDLITMSKTFRDD